MGIFDEIVRRAPGVLAQRQAGKLKGEATRYDRDREDQEFQARARAEAIQQALMDRRQAGEDALRPFRERLLAAQTSDAEAQAAGTGRYAPKPVEPQAPRNIDPLSPEGIEARKRLAGYEASLRPRGTGNVGRYRFLTTSDGQVIRANPQTGQVEPLTHGGDQVRGGRTGNPTEFERKSLAYSQRAAQGLKDLESLGDYQPGGWTSSVAQSARAGGVKGTLLNFTLDNKDQRFLQASAQFVNAINRRDSGAAISQSEWDDAFNRYLPKAGDSPETLAQKAESRRIELEGLQQGAGRAVGAAQGSPRASAEPEDDDTWAANFLAKRRASRGAK